MRSLVDIFPLLGWLKCYQRETFINDLMAGIIVAIMLVPQGIAYALLAGLPPEYGLYSSIFPLLLYSLLGSSRSLAVGPVAIVSLMVSTAISQVAIMGSEEYINAAVNLSLLVGVILLFLRSLRLGAVVNFISHSVLSGFTSAAAIVIAVSQIKHLLGLELPRTIAINESTNNILANLAELNPATLIISVGAFFLLWYSKSKLCCQLQRLQFPEWLVQPICKAGPMFAVIFGTSLVWLLSLDQNSNVDTVGMIPQGLPSLQGIHVDLELWQQLFTPALLIALIGYIESVSVGTALASKRKERIDPNKELIALGVANLGSAFSGSYPIAGGFGRSMVNFSAGAQTTIASAITAVLVAITLVFFTPLFYYLPTAALGAIIIMAVIPLIDIAAFRQCWRFNKADALTLATTFVLVLFMGVEIGILSGIAMSIALLLYRSSQPHIAVVGRVGESEHFRNIDRHDVTTEKSTLALRIDESLYFANTRFVEEFILQQCTENPEIKHVVLICTAVNFIDASALETLEQLVHNLRGEGITLHLSEVKGPVMDQLNSTLFLQQMGDGKIFFTTDQAMKELAGI
ncbi:SulP family inorganic anion transporter [Neptuniibacter sp.]|uniref:SulP family inorganic anion transporter n=1 Tax=Neptuniibacter sp. TaxID=1962643 RepID=UPI0026307E7E|nr:sulfate permease [Neptuniibacter sp.]MCP4597686.1 sulfate permease [Neptuniibacter sp.]